MTRRHHEELQALPLLLQVGGALALAASAVSGAILSRIRRGSHKGAPALIPFLVAHEDHTHAAVMAWYHWLGLGLLWAIVVGLIVAIALRARRRNRREAGR